MIGRSISHYKITDKLGAGGMGEVFLATDSKLNRSVALKLIPQAFTADPQRLARFQREAEVLASLNHPNIAAIYGIEEADGLRALVLELVGGPTLEERIEQGAVPVEEALGIALQIAEALEAAHERGVIHRDLKPANIKLTTDDRVKVLDFGLAKAFDAATPASGASGLSNSPTMTQAMTGAGVLLGTASFMSPEQARGKDADKRADVWAFGVVLFEMLVGHRLYSGETVSDTLAAVLRAEPNWDELPKDLPREIRRLLERCLERDVRLRLRDIGEARILLARVVAGDREPDAAVPAAAPEPAKRGLSAQVVMSVALGAALIGAAAVYLLRPAATAELPLRKSAITFDSTDPGASSGFHAHISPDGRYVAYLSRDRLWIRDLEQTDPMPVETPVTVASLFWSHDSKWLAFAERNAIWKVPVEGGKPTKIATLKGSGFSTVGGGTWGPDDRILFSTGNDAVYAVSANGGDPAVFCDSTSTFTDFHEIGALPEGRGWVTVGHRRSGTYDTICLVTPGGGLEEILVVKDHGLHNPTWSPSGHILFERGGGTRGVWALPFSLKTLKPAGDAFLAAADGTRPSAADDGSMAYVLAPSAGLKEIVSVDRRGGVLGVHSATANMHAFPDVSPDETRAVIRISDGESRELWSIDMARKTSTRLTFSDERKDMASFSPDGATLYGYEGEFPVFTLIRFPADGSRAHEVLRPGLLPHLDATGATLYFTQSKSDRPGDFDIYSLPLDHLDGEPRKLLATGAAEWWSVPSPDGRYLAYVSDESGENQVFVTSLPDLAGKWQISRNGGHWPRWRADGSEIVFADDQGIMSTEIDRSQGFRPGATRQLFPRPGIFGLPWPDGFDMSADAERFYLVRGHVEDDDAVVAAPRIVVVQNWAREF